MKNTLVYLLLVCTVHFAYTKCPAPYPGEHGPCGQTCGLSSHCSSGLWCCTTPCGGTVCKIPDIPRQPTLHHHEPPAIPIPKPTPVHHYQPPAHHHQPPAHTPVIPKLTTTHHHQHPVHVPDIQTQTTLQHHQQPAHTPIIPTQTTLHHRQPLAHNAIPHIPPIPTRQEAQQQLSLYQELFPELQPGFQQQVPLFIDPNQQNVQADISHQTNIYQDQVVNIKSDVFPDHAHEQHFMDSHTQPPLFLEPQQGIPQYNNFPTAPPSNHGNTRVEETCPPDQPRVQCWHDPCNGRTCTNFPVAVCEVNHCGDCSAMFTMATVDVTRGCEVRL
ncbi:uncharacterized protein LOC134719061 [Mytilus trossulus]|uniref:uncharacterized protein LOC134719061 n=1 Tax=Mytilus trossulus TaxID=6551 RepID=UPI003005FBAA